MKKQLSSGLVLRTLSEGHETDRERLPDFLAETEEEGQPENIKENVRRWTRLLMNGHPTTTPDDIFVIVNPAKDDLIVSAMLLIPQTWRYEDVDLAVGRPELVATHPDYRNRGLVRELMEVVHARSAALGHQIQAITGIPHYYRKFGYTMALDMGVRAVFPLAAQREPKPDAIPAFTLRSATASDAPDIAKFRDVFARERLITEHHSLDVLRYEIAGRTTGKFPSLDYVMILDASGRSVGYLTLPASSFNKYWLACSGYVVGREASYAATFADVMQGLRTWAASVYGACPGMLEFGMGLHDSVYTLIDKARSGAVSARPEYAWYLRVPDAVRFLQHIVPVLERRLDGSGAHRYTGRLRIGFFDLTGIAITFDNGHIASIERMRDKDGYDVQFPWQMFWTLVFGHRSAAEISFVVPEVSVWGAAAVLLDSLFPKRASWLHGLV